LEKIKTVNSLSGGKTSSYIAANYKADYNVFALVRTNDKKCLFPDHKIRQQVSDRLGTEFIGTLEDNMIIYTMLDLEQYIGQKIDWVTGKTFDEIIKKKTVFNDKGEPKVFLPQSNRRYCTTELKLEPIKKYWLDNINEVCDMRIGFRANEMRRAKTMIEKLNKEGLQSDKFIVGKYKNGNNKWELKDWRIPSFPLITDGIFKDKIEKYWNNKPVKFAWVNNCVGCMGASAFYIKHQYSKNQNKIQWFIDQEKKSLKDYKRAWRIDGLTYEQIISHNSQIKLFDDDFNECDSGYCGV